MILQKNGNLALKKKLVRVRKSFPQSGGSDGEMMIIGQRSTTTTAMIEIKERKENL